MSERRPSKRVNFHAPSIVYLWVLRILVTLGAQREFITEHVFTNDGLASVLGLSRGPYSPTLARARLKRIHGIAERAAADTQCERACNIDQVRGVIGIQN